MPWWFTPLALFAIIAGMMWGCLKLMENDAKEYLEREYPWYGKTMSDWLEGFKRSKR